MKIGLLASRSGPAGLWTPSFDSGAFLAAAELNARGGILDGEIELVIADAGLTERAARASSGALVDIEDVDAIIGLHPSNVRDAIKHELAGRVPYIYTPQYEGGERAPGTVAIGRMDEELLLPGIEWLARQKAAQRFYLIGNDYVWPRTALAKASTIVGAAGGSVVGKAIIPFDREDYGALMEDIRRTRPHVVVMALLGLEAARFNRAFAEAGLAGGILRFGLCIDETVLYATGADCAENLFTALTYLPNMRSAANERFLELYREEFGEAVPPANTFSQCGYEGVHVLAGLAARTGLRDRLSLARSVSVPRRRSVARRALPAGSPVGLHPDIHIAVADGLEFRIVSTH